MHIIKILMNTADHEREFFQIRMSASPELKSLAECIVRGMAILDSKSETLLTFISVVIAALIFAYTSVDTKTEYYEYIRCGFYFFMAAFSVAGTLNIRCLNLMSRHDFGTKVEISDFEQVMLSEIAVRRKRYRLALLIVESCLFLLLIFMLSWVALIYDVFRI